MRKAATSATPISRALRKGSAFIELAFGLFALALALASLFGFSAYIVKALAVEDEARRDAGSGALLASGNGGQTVTTRDSLDVEPFAADYIFSSKSVPIVETVYITNMKGID